MKRFTALQQRGIVRDFKEGRSMGDIAYVWSVRVVEIEAIIRWAVKVPKA